jgi:hypothetical protein
MVRAGVLLLDAEAGEFGLEAVAGGLAAAAAGEPGRVDQPVEFLTGVNPRLPRTSWKLRWRSPT